MKCETDPDKKDYMAQESMYNHSDDEDFEDNIFRYDVNIDQIKDYFDFILITNKGKKSAMTKASKTVDFIKRKKTGTNSKLKKIQAQLMNKLTAKNSVKDFKSPPTNKSK